MDGQRNDQLEFFFGPHSRVIILVPELLEHLGVEDQPRSSQQQAVDAWLGKNEPNRGLRLSLRRHGFIQE